MSPQFSRPFPFLGCEQIKDYMPRLSKGELKYLQVLMVREKELFERLALSWIL